MGSRLESNSKAVRKRIENHNFVDETGDEYNASAFGGFPEYFRRKKIKLQNLDADIRSQASDNPQIFRGIVAHVNGYTQPSLSDLHRIIVSHGGGFMQYLDGKTTVTHIIASSLTPKKAIEFKKYRIVKPAWVVESLAAGKLLPWENFRVLDEGAGQKVLQFENGQISSQINKRQTGYRDQTDSSWYTKHLLHGDGTSKTTDVQIEDVDDNTINHKVESISEQLKFADEGNLDERSQVVHEDGRASSTLSLNRYVESSPSSDEGRLAEEETDNAEIVHQEGPNELNAVSPINHGLLDRKRQGSPATGSLAKKSKLTAEEHNTILLSDPRIRKSSVLNPDFLESYYRESRLHHLSTWKAELKSQLQALTANKSASQKARQQRPAGTRRYILHVDFDSFFVAVSLKNFPQLVDKPAVVAHGAGTGSEIASCNYPARKFGIKNGMWMKRAQELCTDIKVLPYDFEEYESTSKTFYEAILDIGGIVQSVSVDEALVDISSLCIQAGGSDGRSVREGSIWREENKADELAQDLRDSVKKLTGCAVSVGIGNNILLAKVALRKAKPAGQHQIRNGEALEFLADLEVQSLPGIAHNIGKKLEEHGIKFVKDIRETSKERLTNILGPKTGEKIWNYARGIDNTEVGDQVIRKSVSAEVNWGVRFETQEQAEEFIDSLCGELNRRLNKEGVKGKHFTMKVMRRAEDAQLDPPKFLGHGKCDTFNKSITLGVATNEHKIMSREALSILRGFGFSPGELRGLGVQMTKLEPLKAPVDGDLVSSQRRLHFKLAEQSKVTEDQNDDPIQDDPITPTKPKPLTTNKRMGVNLSQDPLTPRKKPLNVLGSQFILPTQVDPEVLAQLPANIRARLTRPSVQASANGGRQSSQAPQVSDSLLFPTMSQLDQDILKELPEDVRADVLAQYEVSPSKHARGQSVLPQSPRKNRVLNPPRKPLSTRGRPRGRGLLSRLRGSSRTHDNSTLTQSNFVSERGQSANDTGPAIIDDISPDFLAALPEDVRKEVVENYRNAQRKRTSGLEVNRRRNQRHSEQNVSAHREPVLMLEPRPRKPTFTTQQLSRLEDVRDAISAWYEEFKSDGPYKEDVLALGNYLKLVVVEEGDMAKVVSVISWMKWLLEDNDGTPSDDATNNRPYNTVKWRRALENLKTCAGDAVIERGLGTLDL